MQNVSIKVGYSRTYMGEYHNVQPQVEIKCQVEPEDISIKIAELLITARNHVQNAIDDALEKQGQPPEFYDLPRYTWVKFTDERLICIYRVELYTALPRSYQDQWYEGGERRGYRVEWLENHKFTPANYPHIAEYTLFYIHNEADIARLPEIVHMVLYRDEQAKEGVLVREGGPHIQPRFCACRRFPNRLPRSLFDNLCHEYPDYHLVLGDGTVDIPAEWLAPD